MKLPNQPAVVVMNALDQAVKAADAPFYFSGGWGEAGMLLW